MATVRDVLAPVARALEKANYPALVIGGAVDQCGGWHDAVRLAEKLRCPVWAAPLEGRPGFPETHELYQGALHPSIGPLSEKFEKNDLVVVIGAPVFRYYPYTSGEFVPKGTSLIHLTDSILFIVLRNHSYCILKVYEIFLGLNQVPGFDLPGIDSVTLAKGYGCEGGYVSDPAELEEEGDSTGLEPHRPLRSVSRD